MARIIALVATESRSIQLDWLRSLLVCSSAAALILADRALPALSL